MLRRVALFALIPVLSVIMSRPVRLLAQEASSEVPPITIRVNTRLVVVDVVVTDKKGQPVTGLKAEDFVIEENGKKQKIAIFTPPDVNQTAAQPVPPGILTNKPEYRKPTGVPTVLLLDAANSHFQDQAYGRNQMLKYVMEQSESGSTIAVMALTDRLRVLQDFTSDPRVLTTAIRNLQPQQPVLQPTSVTPPVNKVEGPIRGSGAPATVATSISATPSGPAADLVAISQAQIESFQSQVVGFQLERRTLLTIQALHDLSRVLGGFPGRKNVVWLTADFPFDLNPGDTNMSDEELVANLPSIANAQNNVIVNGAGQALAQQRGMYNQKIREAESDVASTGIAIYPVDMRGLMTSGIDVNTTSSLQELASQTGGEAYINQNEIKNGIALATADEKASYSLGYYPENKKWDGKFRSVKVKVAQADRKIRCRKGYFAVDPSQVKNPHFETNVAESLDLKAPATQVLFMAQAKSSGPGKVRVVFLVDAHTLSVEDAGSGKKMNVSMYASVYSANGKNLGTRSTKVDRTFDGATYQQILDKGMMVPLDMDMPAGGQELRLAVLDNKTGFIGTANGPLGQ